MAGVFDRVRGVTTTTVEQIVSDNQQSPADVFQAHGWVDYAIGSNTVTQRTRDVTYTNDTGDLLRLWVKSTSLTSTSAITLTLDAGLPLQQVFTSGTLGLTIAGSHTLGPLDIQPGQTYRVSGRAIAEWKEWRIAT